MAYVFHLGDFDGPLDLLLHLVNRAQIQIEDIFVSEITEQYMAYMRQLDDLDMDTASEFLAMAANLLYIKSRSLLPRKPAETVEEEENPEAELIRQLTEYKKYKEAGENLRALEETYKNVFFKLPEEWITKERPVELQNMSIDTLIEAFAAVMSQAQDIDRPNVLSDKIDSDVYTIENRMQYLRKILRENGQVTFHELFEGRYERAAVVTTFLALLELLKAGRLQVAQDNAFSEIYIRAIAKPVKA